MKKSTKILSSVAGSLAVVAIASLLVVMRISAKDISEDTNKSEDMRTYNRGEQETVSEDTISWEDAVVSYELPDGFYFEYENREYGSGVLKEYMDHNYNKMLDVLLFTVHTADIGLIDDENSENSQIYRDLTVDADAWLAEMQMVYLDEGNVAEIKQEIVDGNVVKYFTRGFVRDDGVLQAGLFATVEIDETHYYCVKAVEFEQSRKPCFDDYKELFVLTK